MNSRKHAPNTEDGTFAGSSLMDPLSSGVQAVDERKAAAIMSKSVQSLRNERFIGKGCPYLKLGRSVRYLVSDIQDYLTRNRVDPEKV